ncbi:c-type cytochrome [Rhizobium leguminosarum]|uniref:c-type cytochrome n=1 Tax=Rhizobium leguminosarum TaxID=384 RepID=UPI001C9596A4|nr:c-type cytochrome [Rhizobium leguminosarum]MBY5538249.1 c-type cytochrome [Rhizobium leguminosarum]
MRHFKTVVVCLACLTAVGLLGAVAFFFWPHSLPEVVASASQPSGAALIERGKYLTTAADCEACHTAPGGKPFEGGLGFELPFGTLYSPNITPDTETGIGGWSDAEFVRAVRSGVGKHGEDLYPAFPYTSYALLSSDDVLAIKAYLDTLPPVVRKPPQNDLLFPFNQRYVMRGWKLLFVPGSPFKPDETKSEGWNNGAYLVEALAHCGECHTPRGLMFQRKQGEGLSGGELEGWTAWNITPDASTGIGSWTDEEIASYLSKGYAHGRGPAAGAMRQAIDLSFSRLPESDINDIVAYLRTVPSLPSSYEVKPASTGPAASQASNPWSPHQFAGGLGRQLFEGACASCHGWDGTGQNSSRAALTGSHSVNDPTGANLVRVILHGSTDSIGTATSSMPSFAQAYSDSEIAALSNYVISHFGGKRGAVTPGDVEKAR